MTVSFRLPQVTAQPVGPGARQKGGKRCIVLGFVPPEIVIRQAVLNMQIQRSARMQHPPYLMQRGRLINVRRGFGTGRPNPGQAVIKNYEVKGMIRVG